LATSFIRGSCFKKESGRFLEKAAQKLFRLWA
jgi:hypothetical protein